MGVTLENANPTLYQRVGDREITSEDEDDDVVDEFDSREVFDILFNKMFLGDNTPNTT